jgi:arylsulfatase A-like enzyme
MYLEKINMKKINRREFLGKSAVAAGTFLSLGMASKKRFAEDDKRPNVLFIFSDQQRYDTVSCYGSPIIENLTPNLDRLASEGTMFKYAFTPQPVCGPARACVQTGRYATETGCYRNKIALPSNERTMANWMSEAGYETAYIGKWHLSSTLTFKDESKDINYEIKPVPTEMRGGYKDYWLAADTPEFTTSAYSGHLFDTNNQRRDFPEGRYRADAWTDWAIEYLHNRKKDRPFFLFLSYIEPHHQNDVNHFLGPNGSKDKFSKYNVPCDLDGAAGLDWKEEMPDYLGCCKSLDDNVGRLRRELEILGLAENTLVIYTCDHGCTFNPKIGGYKCTCHDNSIRIPMIINGPGFKGGKVVDEFVNLLDLAPTVLTTGGAALPSTFHGNALQRLVKGDTAGRPEDAFVQMSQLQVGRAIRTKKWTYSVRAPDKNGIHDSCSDVYVEDFLYDNENDPCQKNNLVTNASYKDIRNGLAEKLKQYMNRAGEKTPVIKPI